MSVDLKSKLLPCKEMTAELEVFLSTYYTRTEPNKIVHGDELVVEYYGKNNKNHSPTEERNSSSKWSGRLVAEVCVNFQARTIYA